MWDALINAIFGPKPIARLVIVRVLAPIAILGFMSHRIIHADDWLSDAGFRVPTEIWDWRQPLPIPGIPVWAAWTIAIAFLLSGLATAAGAFTRWSASVFTAIAIYVALADRLAAFTVSKLAPMIGLLLALTPSGVVGSIDAWRKRKTSKAPLPTKVSGGCVSFFQIFLPVFYVSSGIAKAKGAWWGDNWYVLWSHVHDSYQTHFSYWLAGVMPTWMWPILQVTVLIYELGSPIWFGLRWTRTPAMIYGLGMHLMIGLMFGPVIWFSVLMMALLVASYAPMRWLERVPWIRAINAAPAASAAR
jgi:Vitamin K-dependent gamma-carboxylase